MSMTLVYDDAYDYIPEYCIQVLKNQHAIPILEKEFKRESRRTDLYYEYLDYLRENANDYE